jgi:hypothetical protein
VGRIILRLSPKSSARRFASRTIRTTSVGFCVTWDSRCKNRCEWPASRMQQPSSGGARRTGRRFRKARRVGASIAFIEESGIRLQSVNRRIWVPCGQPPVQLAWDRYGQLSVISAVTLSPTRRHISLPFQIHNDTIRTAEAVAFVKQVRRQLAGR